MDDSSLSGVRLAAAIVGEQFRLRVPSRVEWIEPVVDYLTSRAVQCGAVSEARAGRVLIALHEALTNSIIHGNLEVSSTLKDSADDAFVQAVSARTTDVHYANRHVDVVAGYDGQSVRWVLTDEGPGFDVEAMLRRTEEPPDERPCGRGLRLIRAFVDEVQWEDRGRRVVLTIHRPEGAERRCSPRYPVHQNVRVAPIGADGHIDFAAAQDALARNLSPEGISLLQTHLSSTDRVLITIPLVGGPISIPAHVRHCIPLENGAVEVGCRFEPSSSSSLLHPVHPLQPGRALRGPLTALLDRLTRLEVPGQDRRIHPRVPFAARIAVRLPGPDDQPLLHGYGRDLSHSGIAFVSRVPFPLEVVTLTLPPDEGGATLSIQARILRCTWIMDGFYDIAARFLAE